MVSVFIMSVLCASITDCEFTLVAVITLLDCWCDLHGSSSENLLCDLN